MAELWRLHLRPKGIDSKDVVHYCLKEGIFGAFQTTLKGCGVMSIWNIFWA